MTERDRAGHWDDAYANAEHSWDEVTPDVSLDMFDAAGVRHQASVIDVGGGASALVGALLDRGHRDVTVLDVSSRALESSRDVLGLRADHVHWVNADITDWQPPRVWQVWHDRAAFHFLTASSEREAYVRALLAGTTHGSVVVIGTFAPDGPEQCSGLSVQRYDTAGLVAALPSEFSLIADLRHIHVTPRGGEQPFTWVALRRT